MHAERYRRERVDRRAVERDGFENLRSENSIKADCLTLEPAYAIFSMLCVCYTQFLKNECDP